MNLIVDQGNTSVKIAVFQDETMLENSVLPQLNMPLLVALYEKYAIKQVILSMVRNVAQEFIDFFIAHSLLFFMDSTLRLPIVNKYATPYTLGGDRLAVSVAAYMHNCKQPLLIIDVGTAITYEFVLNGCYCGGNITPGLEMRFRALHTFTEKLPYVEADGVVELVGTSTETAIRSGVIAGIVDEMEGEIVRLKNKYPDLFVFLTGGASFFFEKRLKSAIFVDKFLLLKGLNYILKYNVDK